MDYESVINSSVVFGVDFIYKELIETNDGMVTISFSDQKQSKSTGLHIVTCKKLMEEQYEKYIDKEAEKNLD